jgi:hypothetical protein
VTARATRLVAVLFDIVVWLLPPARQQWAEAIQAEAGQMPAGWRQLQWLAGGLWFVAREANMTRKFVYWMGLGAATAAAVWAIWLSWRTGQAADPESLTDRFRILAGASALLVLPWAGRRAGVLGPVADGMTARVVRIAGFLAICGVGVQLVRLDRNAGAGSTLGSGHFSWPREIIGLALLGVAAAIPLVIRALRPRVDASAVWGPAIVAAVAAFAVLPLQVLVILYVAGILAATSRRSLVASGTLAIGAFTGVATGLILYGTVEARLGVGVLVYLLLWVSAFLVAAALAGFAAGWLRSGAEGMQELQAQRASQGLLAGITAGAAGGLVISVAFAAVGLMMIIGPLAGAAGGALGGAIAARYPRKSLPSVAGIATSTP